MTRRVVLFIVCAALWTSAAAAQQTPSVDQLISLKRVGSVAISPDGRQVVYTVREADWDDDRYETEIWLVDVASGNTRQLTNARKSSSSPSWSPNGTMIAFTSDRSDKQQIYVIRVAGGEAEPVTSAEDGVGGGFAWAPDGASIAYTMTDPKPDTWKNRDKKYGDFEIVDADQRLSHLWVIDLATRTPKRLTKGDFAVGSYDWSLDGREISAFLTTHDSARFKAVSVGAGISSGSGSTSGARSRRPPTSGRQGAWAWGMGHGFWTRRSRSVPTSHVPRPCFARTPGRLGGVPPASES